jgi:hypothetical protein
MSSKSKDFEGEKGIMIEANSFYFVERTNPRTA